MMILLLNSERCMDWKHYFMWLNFEPAAIKSESKYTLLTNTELLCPSLPLGPSFPLHPNLSFFKENDD
jgi:hypothetical protein